jgi:hypothetical protein
MNCAIETSKTMKGFMFCNRWIMKLVQSNPIKGKKPNGKSRSTSVK